MHNIKTIVDVLTQIGARNRDIIGFTLSAASFDPSESPVPQAIGKSFMVVSYPTSTLTMRIGTGVEWSAAGRGLVCSPRVVSSQSEPAFIPTIKLRTSAPEEACVGLKADMQKVLYHRARKALPGYLFRVPGGYRYIGTEMHSMEEVLFLLGSMLEVCRVKPERQLFLGNHEVDKWLLHQPASFPLFDNKKKSVTGKPDAYLCI